MTTRLLLLLALFLTTACATAPTKTPPPTTLTFTDSQHRTYNAQLRLPRNLAIRNNHTALLLGGGSTTDMHWSVPASVEHEGETIPLTSTGEPTHDADDIAAALLAKGFAVFQYSSIHNDDATHAGNPALADHVPYPSARDIARAALDTLRAQPSVDPDRLVVVAHSLGAARALQIIDADPTPFRAAVLLAPAYVSHLATRPSLAAQPTIEAIAELDLDADLGIPRHRWNAARSVVPEPLRGIPFDELDRDDDETLRRWEIAAATILSHLDDADTSDLSDTPLFADESHPADILLQSSIPTLLIFGALDTITVHAPLIELAAPRHHRTGLDIRIVRGGHNLSREIPRPNPDHFPLAGPTLVAPINPMVTRLIANWLAEAIAPAN